eukprot:TRINITY_DN10310_c0_g1_i1.p1 TRINITY_DN10310_c0_g1~~TRINITY_DN10310_c0_g1_i1.p1  ORF type:complete len:203 (+),score=56.48 TRINITY_DN10310_c0_g1_i1:326-934(+)
MRSTRVEKTDRSTSPTKTSDDIKSPRKSKNKLKLSGLLKTSKKDKASPRSSEITNITKTTTFSDNEISIIEPDILPKTNSDSDQAVVIDKISEEDRKPAYLEIERLLDSPQAKKEGFDDDSSSSSRIVDVAPTVSVTPQLKPTCRKCRLDFSEFEMPILTMEMYYHDRCFHCELCNVSVLPPNIFYVKCSLVLCVNCEGLVQ